MKRQLLTILGAFAIAACGPKAKPTTTPEGKTGDADADGDHDDAVDESAHHHDHPDTPPDVQTPPPGPDAAQQKADLLAAETTAYDAAKPVFAKYCAGCHQQGGKKATGKKLGHFDITTYPLAGHHASEVGSVVREVLGIGGTKPTMPYDKPGAVKGDELALIAAWADAFDAAKAGGAHEGNPAYQSSADPD